ncbi:aspartate--ammonia ligase [Bacillus mesophilus]|uniref:Aspartate--ammonia ligase n=1 Tax=Bacillus mesophilus TaxID=1808955 RepID=A0A6M0QAS8_9BACI|nr:aspartate--ammonia ligase [Bacillus mesophilus]MBM7662912.1 aspartate--ammonia ligase [Bacillus mesophilus]NEY73501.1 aspartate--ammonia ligase [Bacillus mesophilus]
MEKQLYKPLLSLLDTEEAIKNIKDYFEMELSESLQIKKVSAPLMIKGGQGINDDLNGVERITSFSTPDITESAIEVVQSLAKWKRVALGRYNLPVGKGLYTKMIAIRSDEELDATHSLFVDQWDWEKVITREQRTEEMLKSEVKKIYRSIKDTETYIHEYYPELKPVLPEEITFITSQELEDQYPGHTPKERENVISKKYGAVFIMKIGHTLNSGEKHDGRAPDYDDWSLNGDIIVWNPTLESAFELSSMGIRVDSISLVNQLQTAYCLERLALPFHQSVLKENVPFSIGGGIGQSRLCMFLLKKMHIGEVQASFWGDSIIEECKTQNIPLL